MVHIHCTLLTEFVLKNLEIVNYLSCVQTISSNYLLVDTFKVTKCVILVANKNYKSTKYSLG